MSIFTNPTPQLLDNNGSPLAGAKLYFFETGTSTLKTIYSDSSFTTAQSNPVIADANGRITSDVYLDGVYRVVGQTSSGVGIDGWDKDPVGTVDTSAFGPWANDSTYSIPDIVKGSDDSFYQTLTDVNQGNDPTTDTVNWAILNLQTLTAATAGNIYYGGASAAGTDTYAATLSTSPVAYAVGQRYQFLADVANTGACTINFNALGAKSIKLLDGNDPYSGAIRVGPVDVIYDGTNFVLLSEFIASTYCGASAAGTDTYAVTAPGLPTAYTTGDKYSFKADVVNTGACTVNFNAIGAANIKSPDGSDPFDGAIPAGSIPIVEHDGTNFILQNAYYSDDPTTVKNTAGEQVLVGSVAIENTQAYLRVRDTATAGSASTYYGYIIGTDSVPSNVWTVGRISGSVNMIVKNYVTNSDIDLQTTGTGVVTANGNPVWDDSGSNGPAAVAGYTKAGSGIYRKDTYAGTALTYNVLATVAAPAGAAGVIVLLIANAKAANGVAARSSQVYGYSDAGTTVCARSDALSYESTAIATAETLSTNEVEVIIPVISGNFYIKHALRDAGANSNGSYALVGYTV